MDLKTIFICVVFTSFFNIIFLFFVRHTRERYSGVDFWIISIVFLILGYFLLIARGKIPDFFSIIIAQSFFYFAMILRIIGIKIFFGEKYIKKLIFAFLIIFLAYLGVLLFFRYITDSILIRTATIGILLSSLSIYSAVIMFRNKPDNNYFPYVFMALLFILFSFTFLLRIFSWFLFPDIRELFNNSILNSFQFLLNIGIEISWTFMFFIINNQILNSDLFVSEAQKKAILD
ncbi:MAG TPA: hypothetical protein PLO89_09860, partial [Spirochaetota bacterium]|nr:hypothetical protein [Spirochaetota bacterium]